MTARYEAERPGAEPWRRGCGPFRSWHPVEILAMVLGFAVWWPVGLAVLAWKIAQKKGYPVPDFYAMVRERFGFRPENRKRWRPFEPTSGNAAFDEWRKAELEKLEEQRRKLDEAERKFADHMENLRRARDQDEFDRSMAERRSANPA